MSWTSGLTCGFSFWLIVIWTRSISSCPGWIPGWRATTTTGVRSLVGWWMNVTPTFRKYRVCSFSAFSYIVSLTRCPLTLAMFPERPEA